MLLPCALETATSVGCRVDDEIAHAAEDMLDQLDVVEIVFDVEQVTLRHPQLLAVAWLAEAHSAGPATVVSMRQRSTVSSRRATPIGFVRKAAAPTASSSALRSLTASAVRITTGMSRVASS